MLAASLVLVAMLAGAAPAQQPADAAAIRTAISQLGSFDFATRTNAARVVRRAPAAIAVPALREAVTRTDRDEYVRFKAFVLLSQIDPAVTAQIAQQVLPDRNDRVRTVAYQWFEHHPDPAVVPALVRALATEQSEFVRPALTRALAAAGTGASVRDALAPLVMRGQDLFRGAVIEALGDYGGRYALADITAVAQLDGPLQDDAVTALGRLGDASSRAVLAKLQDSAPRELQPTISAALCLQGVDCDARLAYLKSTLEYASANPSYQPLLRGVVHALAVLAVSGREPALAMLFDAGVTSKDPARAAITLGVGFVALRNADVVLKVMAQRADSQSTVALVGDAFDMLSSEDFEEERFGADVRRALASAPAGAPERRVAEALIKELEY
ncbi:MAG TPA: HEAT repeat domain-containing protein [Vicinamibacterales bacterium]|jgi:HEAT repeat protein|nr:HEAT repeat domain-containing protein [Vicinamibacterales bacterium]